MMVGLYGPSSWPLMATGLDYLLNDNLTGFAEAWAPLSVSIIGNSNLNSMGIRCSDRFARVSRFEEYDEVMDRQHDLSRFMGGRSLYS